MQNAVTRSVVEDYLSSHPKVLEWLNTFRPPTRRLYIRNIITFERLSNTPIEDLLDKAENNQIKPVLIRSLIISSLQNLTNPNQVMTDAAVRSFLKYWGINSIPRTTIHYQETRFYRGYIKTELQRLIEYLDKPLEKLYTIVGAESGLRAETILALKWKHLANDFNNRTDSIALRLELSFHKGRKKTGYTFIGLRSRELLKFCIENNQVKTYDEANIFPYSDNSIRTIIQTAKHKARLDPTIHPIHGLRKYFKAGLESPKPPIDEYHQRMMMGRFGDIDSKTYSPRSFDILRPEYERAYTYLDYMNNAPEQAQELSTKHTQLEQRMAQLEENNTQLKQTIKNLLLQQQQDAILASQALTKTEPIRELANFLEACDHMIPDRVIDTNAPDPTTDHQAYRAHVRKINEDNYPRIIQYMKDKRQVPDTMPIHLLTDHERETQRELAERIVKAFKRQQGMVELTPADQQIISSILSQITIQEHEG